MGAPTVWPPQAGAVRSSRGDDCVPAPSTTHALSRRDAVLGLGGTAVLASVLALAYGPGYAGYDAAWSLVWGDELLHLRRPSYEVAFAPTPHPLANLVTAPLTLAGTGESALIAITFAAFAALVVATGVLAGRLFGLPAAFVAALIIATRPQLAREVAFASIDLPFLALVMSAAAVEAARPRAGRAVLVLLLLAGLLRPEAWVLALAYLIWLGRPMRGAHVALVIAAPLLWALTDLLATGDPTHSLTGTRALAEDLERVTGADAALRALPDSVQTLVGAPVAVAALAGVALVATRRPRTLALPLALIVAGLVTFVVLGAAGLPVLSRYLLAPACMLAVLAGAAITTDRHPAALIAAALVLAVVASGAPPTVRELGDARSFTAARGGVQRDLQALARDPRFGAAAGRCPELRIPDFRTRPVLAFTRELDPETLVIGALGDGEAGLLVTYARERTRYVFNLGAPGESPPQPAPAGSRTVGANAAWLAYASC